MAFARRIQNPEGLYFITFATVQWVDVFTRSIYIDIVLESLKILPKRERFAYSCVVHYVKACAFNDFYEHQQPTVGRIERF
jgi:hypothetical protein